jgi:uncharacterized repeat protein (TIGR02543 family)
MKTQKNAALVGIFTALAIFGLFFATCGDPMDGPTGGNTIAVTGVKLDISSKTLFEGETFTLTPTVTPLDASNNAVSWSSSDTGKATVANGLVTAKDAGTAKITVTTNDGNKTAECTVTVNRTPASIAVTGQPAKTKYAPGETLDLTGLVVTATYSDTTTGTVTVTLENITGFDPDTEGEQTLTITYGGTTTTFIVTVIGVSKIEVTAQPSKTRFAIGEPLDITGLEVTATYNDNSTGIVMLTPEHITGFNPNLEGEQTLTITYGGKTTTFKVTVIGVSKIEVTAQPSKTIYATGEQLDITGLEVTATYSDGTTETVTINTGHITGFNSATPGTKTLTITYSGKTTTFTVTVVQALAVPSGLQANDATLTLTWNAVSNASGYTVDIDGTEYQANTNNYSLSGLTTPKTYTIKVKAKGNGTTYADSAWSGTVQYTVTGFTPGLLFTLMDDGTAYEVSRGTATATTIVIPSVYNGLPVTTIANCGFQDYTAMTGITIPDSVTSIGLQAFYSCSGLTSVTIPSSVTSIETYAFGECSELKNITIPDSLMSIGYGVFISCSSLESINIPVNVTSIGDNAFSGCNSLTRVFYGGADNSAWSGITIGNYNDTLTNTALYFYSATQPTVIGNYWRFVDGVPTIWEAFLPPPSTSGLLFTLINDGMAYSVSKGTATDTEIVIPSIHNNLPVTTITERGFNGYTAMTSVIIPDSVTSISGEYAFAGCSGLTSITIPDSMISLGEWAFANCSNLESITIPNGVTSIGTATFYNCSGLTSVTIPANVTIIGHSAFYNCSSLTRVFYGGVNNTAWSAITISGANIPLTNATRYYYSATQPTEDGNFWRFVDGVPTVWGEALKRLATPSGLQFNYTIKTLAWNAVTNAISYLIDIDGTEYQSATNSYSLSSLTTPATYTIKVKAIGNGITYSDSEWSEAVQYIISKPLAKIEITGQPAKTRYAIGEQLVLTGLEVTATYSDDTMEIVPITAGHITGFNSASAGQKTLTITYIDQTTTFTVTVVAVVTFNPNGGNWNGSIANKTEEVAGTTVTKPDNPSREGYTFGEWYKEAALSNQWNFASDTVSTNINLYAKWNPITYMVRYDKNDTTASGTMADSSHTYDVEKALTANSYTRTNYAFSGWNTQADGSGTNYADRQNVKNLTTTAGEIVTLYAVWQTQDALDFGQGASMSTFNVSNTTEWNSAVSTITSGGNNNNYIINVIADFTVAGRESDTFGSVTGIKVSIRGVGRTLTLAGTGRILSIAANQTVILRDVTLKGSTSNNTYLVAVVGTFIMNDGKIIGNTNRGATGATTLMGSGVYVSTNGSFIMNSGEIYDNVVLTERTTGSASSNNTYGGGVFVYTSGSFTMNGGTIRNNTISAVINSGESKSQGGGVFVYTSGIFTMNGGEIHSNRASAGKYYSSTSTTNSYAYGGGVCVSSGTFIMYNGEIYSNTCDGQTSNWNSSHGGGVHLINRATFTMSGGKIRDNKAIGISGQAYGGGVYIGIGDATSGTTTFTMNGGEISGNSASGNSTGSSYGGGVYVGGATTFRLSNGTIYGSNAASDIRNTADTGGASLYRSIGGNLTNGTATYGPSGTGTTLNTTNDTIRVVGGVLQQ